MRESSAVTTFRTSFAMLLLVALVTLAACNDTGNSSAAESTEYPPDAYPGGDLLISADELDDLIDDPDLRIIDLSPVRTYREGHIPNAVHIWWQDTIEIHNDIYGMMPDRDTRDRLFRDAGIGPDSIVVVYDDSGGHAATRFLWLLHVIGFDQNVRLLNGGRQAWEAAGYDLTRDTPDWPDAAIEQSPNYDVLIGDGDGDVLAAIDDPATIIVDGRTEDERAEDWFGRLRSGQIPTSVRLPRDETLQSGIPYFKSPDELSGMLPDGLNPAGDEIVIAYGLHGVAASHTWFTLRLLGFEPVRMYDGSWAEWGANPERPIEEIP